MRGAKRTVGTNEISVIKVDGGPAGQKNNPDNTNTLFLSQSLLAPYIGKNLAVCHCPADQSLCTIGGRRFARVRSISMNIWLGDYDATTGRDTPYGIAAAIGPGKVIRKTSELAVPSNIFNMIDERDDSINDSYFVVAMFNQPSAQKIVDYPSSFHNGAGGLSFAEGHSEIHRWLDARTTPKHAKDFQLQVWPPRTCPNNKDLTWLQERGTGLK